MSKSIRHINNPADYGADAPKANRHLAECPSEEPSGNFWLAGMMIISTTLDYMGAVNKADALESRISAAREGCSEHDLIALEVCDKALEIIAKTEKRHRDYLDRITIGMGSAHEAFASFIEAVGEFFNMPENGDVSQKDFDEAFSLLAQQKDDALENYWELLCDIRSETEEAMKTVGRLEELVSAVELICKAE